MCLMPKNAVEGKKLMAHVYGALYENFMSIKFCATHFGKFHIACKFMKIIKGVFEIFTAD